MRPLLPALALFGAFLVTPSAAHTADEPTAVRRVLTDFGAATPDLGWRVVNDGVMGGRSRGGYEVQDGVLRFRGSTNTDGGGFSSIRARGLQLDLGAFDGIRLRVRADGRRYTWRLQTDARWRGRTVGYWADFDTRKDAWVTVEIPWQLFRPQWRGRRLDGPALDPRRIRGVGLMIYDNRDGAFRLDLDRVEAYATARPFSLADVRWKRRVLVVAAPTREDPRLARQLAEVAASRAGFEERDMLLVVLAGAQDSTVGDRPLRAADVAAIRKAVGLDPRAFGVALVGKDGGVKRRAAEPTAMSSFYTLIDTMPMRRAEMRERAREAR